MTGLGNKMRARKHQGLTRTVGGFLQLSVSRRGTWRGAWRRAAAPLWTVNPAIGDPAHLLEDRADESNSSSGAAVHLAGQRSRREHQSDSGLTFYVAA